MDIDEPRVRELIILVPDISLEQTFTEFLELSMQDMRYSVPRAMGEIMYLYQLLIHNKWLGTAIIETYC